MVNIPWFAIYALFALGILARYTGSLMRHYVRLVKVSFSR